VKEDEMRMYSLNTEIARIAFIIKHRGKKEDQDLLDKIARIYELKGREAAKIYMLASKIENKKFFSRLFDFMEKQLEYHRCLIEPTIIRSYNGIIEYY